MNSVQIRKGTENDIKALRNLIVELAIYEKAPNEVTVTEEELIADGFGPNKIFDFFVAEEDQSVVGIALYYTKYSTWKGKCIYLEDIVVQQSHRQKGIGQMLFNAVAKVAATLGVKRMEWQVLEWNEPAIAFYQKNNAIIDAEWFNGKLTDKELQAFL